MLSFITANKTRSLVSLALPPTLCKMKNERRPANMLLAERIYRATSLITCVSRGDVELAFASLQGVESGRISSSLARQHLHPRGGRTLPRSQHVAGERLGQSQESAGETRVCTHWLVGPLAGWLTCAPTFIHECMNVGGVHSFSREPINSFFFILSRSR